MAYLYVDTCDGGYLNLGEKKKITNSSTKKVIFSSLPKKSEKEKKKKKRSLRCISYKVVKDSFG
jgi:hypothetical protein